MKKLCLTMTGLATFTLSMVGMHQPCNTVSHYHANTYTDTAIELSTREPRQVDPSSPTFGAILSELQSCCTTPSPQKEAFVGQLLQDDYSCVHTTSPSSPTFGAILGELQSCCTTPSPQKRVPINASPNYSYQDAPTPPSSPIFSSGSQQRHYTLLAEESLPSSPPTNESLTSRSSNPFSTSRAFSHPFEGHGQPENNEPQRTHHQNERAASNAPSDQKFLHLLLSRSCLDIIRAIQAGANLNIQHQGKMIITLLAERYSFDTIYSSFIGKIISRMNKQQIKEQRDNFKHFMSTNNYRTRMDHSHQKELLRRLKRAETQNPSRKLMWQSGASLH